MTTQLDSNPCEELTLDTSNPLHAHYAVGYGGRGCIAACGYVFTTKIRRTQQDFNKDPCPICLEAVTGFTAPIACNVCLTLYK